jgi:hypothetical protein
MILNELENRLLKSLNLLRRYHHLQNPPKPNLASLLPQKRLLNA